MKPDVDHISALFANRRFDSEALPYTLHKHTRPISWNVVDDEKKQAPATNNSSRRRRHLWDIDGSLHCSIVGTCLTTDELRALIRRLKVLDDLQSYTDHDIHKLAVTAIGKHLDAAKQIGKALDQRHILAITRFDKTKGAQEVRKLWEEAARDGDIPGAFWAVLTHPDTDTHLLGDVFGHVHMLSHLVGSANRADIRRLHDLTISNAELKAKVDALQTRLHETITARESRVRELEVLLATKVDRSTTGTGYTGAISGDVDTLLANLHKELELHKRLRERAERRNDALAATLSDREECLASISTDLAGVRNELKAAEETLQTLVSEPRSDGPRFPQWHLTGRTVLYVGGRDRQVGQLREFIERAAGTLLHHDGGLQEKPDLLHGLVGKADIAVFPVECISHNAALSLKKLCQQLGKPYVPLRSTGWGALLHALKSTGVASNTAAKHATA